MPPRGTKPDVIRVVEGVKGKVPMSMQLMIRFDYGSVVPWVRNVDEALVAIGGPDALCLRTPVHTCGKGLTTEAHFTVSAGESVPFVLTWFPSHEPLPRPLHPARELETTRVATSERSRGLLTKSRAPAVIVPLLAVKRPAVFIPPREAVSPLLAKA